MKVKAKFQFIDLKENRVREIDEEFEVTQSRFDELTGTKFGALVEAMEEVKDIEEVEEAEVPEEAPELIEEIPEPEEKPEKKKKGKGKA